MTIPPPITLKHTRRDLAKIAAFCVLFPLALGSVVWGVEGLHDAILSAAALEVAFGIIFVVCVGTRLRYGPGRSIEYRCFGRTKTISLDTILSWSGHPTGCAVPVVCLTLRPGSGARPRTLLLGVPGTRADFDRFCDFLSTILPPSAP